MGLLSRRRRVILATTICSTALLLAVAATAEDSVTETELVQRLLQSLPIEAELRAVALRQAAGVAPGGLPNPELEYRHDEARGPAGARTDAIGASFTIDLGFVAVAESQAARLRGEAAIPQSRQDLVDDVCSLRRDLTELWEAQRRVRVVETGYGRLHELISSFEAMVALGEVSAYDLNRASLADTAHRIEIASAAGDVAALQASVATRTGQPVVRVQLVEVGEPHSLEELLDRARTEHPELVALRLQQAAATRDEAAARREAAPSIRLSGAARFDSLSDGSERTPGFELGATLELPIFDQNLREARSSAADTQMWVARVARRERQILASIEAAWRRGAIVRDLAAAVVDTEAFWPAALSRYMGGEGSVDDLLQTARDLEEAQLASLEAEVLMRSADLSLQCAVGRFDDPGIQAALEEALQ
jgi:outer membrane protein TolC